MAEDTQYTVATDSTVYYGSGYWNDLPEVNAYINSRLTGRPDNYWFDYLKQVTGGRTFRKGLFLNCGNGWAERDLLSIGVVADAVGVDISEELLNQARSLGEGLSVRYYACDTNLAQFPEGDYDLVVNYSAGHHIAYLDRVLQAVATMLPEDGVFASFDYVGPHRNQYPYDQWQAATRLNASLPEHYRGSLPYPHFPTLMVGDPTEGIHSELVLETAHRYFDLDVTPVGGGLGYLLLSFNPGVHSAPETERAAVVQQVLDADAAWTAEHGPMFAFFWGRARKNVLADAKLMASLRASEEEREALAAGRYGEYYPRTLLQQLTEQVSGLIDREIHLTDHAGRLRAQLDEERAIPRGVRAAVRVAVQTRAPALARALRL